MPGYDRKTCKYQFFCLKIPPHGNTCHRIKNYHKIHFNQLFQTEFYSKVSGN